MMGEAAVPDAVERARNLPNLGVGLHIVLTAGHAVLPTTEIPALVDTQGRFDENMVRSGIKYFFLPHVRRQLKAEIRAQFEAFKKTGLRLDHVNAHRHFHLHPTLANMILEIGQDYGMKSMRVPYEPVAVLRKAAPGEHISTPIYMPWVKILGARLRFAGMKVNDSVFGLQWSGAMKEDRVLSLIRSLPPGLNELYLHPATSRTDRLIGLMPDYHHVEEFKALTGAAVRQAVNDAGIKLMTYSQAAS
jgi:hopanoid biosynthesis associated protein HpnK